MSSEVSEEAYQRLRERPDYQFDLPDTRGIEDQQQNADPTGFLADLFEAFRQFFEFVGPALRVGLICFAVLLAGHVVWSVFRGIKSRRRRIGSDGLSKTTEDALKNMDMRPDEGEAMSLLAKADALAEAGDFAAAQRLLLHSSFRDMQVRVRERIGVSLTARELEKLGKLSDTSRAALTRLVRRVELNAFAQESVDQAGFLAAREAYSRFAFGEASP